MTVSASRTGNLEALAGALKRPLAPSSGGVPGRAASRRNQWIERTRDQPGLVQNRHRHSRCRAWRDRAFSLNVMGSGIVTKQSGELHPASRGFRFRRRCRDPSAAEPGPGARPKQDA